MAAVSPRTPMHWIVPLGLSCLVHGGVVSQVATLRWSTAGQEAVIVPLELIVADVDPPKAMPLKVSAPAPRPAHRSPESSTSAKVAEAPAHPPIVETTERPPPSVAIESTVASPTTTATSMTARDPEPAASASGIPVVSNPRGAFPSHRLQERGEPGAKHPVVTQQARPRGGYQIRPIYPAAARLAGAQGTTILRVRVQLDGHLDEVAVHQSAGHLALDEAATAAVARWRFEPARNGAEPVAVWVLIPVEFRLKSDLP